MKFMELFAGIGGFRYGLEKASKISTHTHMKDLVFFTQEKNEREGG